MLKTRRACLITFVCCFSFVAFSQSKVSITIDDVPNTEKYTKDNFDAKLLNKLDTLQVPIAIFINEGLVFKTDSVVKNFELLDHWIKREFTELGNHSYSHPHYSQVGVEAFIDNIDKGEHISKALALKYNKPLSYFRFPFNDLGKDSIQQYQISKALKERDYIVAPFTVESSDWMYNYLYEYYLRKEDKAEAIKIANAYIEKTLEYFDFFDKLSKTQYGRKIHHIYLCHDNSLNADYIDVLIHKLKEKKYEFISLSEALEDPVYSQPNVYYKKWGVSWLYRWMPKHNERIRLMKQEPKINDIYKLYQEIVSIED
nr:polysaccharide deacetylase family protein [uncultured Psychroserpens sp.]